MTSYGKNMLGMLVLLGLFFVLLFVCNGCSLLPGLGMDTSLNVEVLYDAEGVPEAQIYVTEGGEPLIDPTTGVAAEVPGSRQKFADAGETDSNLATLLISLGLIGIPGVGIAGKLIGAVRPNQRFAGLVNAVEKIKEIASGGNGRVSHTSIRRILNETSDQIVGMEKAVKKVKADAKTAAKR